MQQTQHKLTSYSCPGRIREQFLRSCIGMQRLATALLAFTLLTISAPALASSDAPLWYLLDHDLITLDQPTGNTTPLVADLHHPQAVASDGNTLWVINRDLQLTAYDLTGAVLWTVNVPGSHKDKKKDKKKHKSKKSKKKHKDKNSRDKHGPWLATDGNGGVWISQNKSIHHYNEQGQPAHAVIKTHRRIIRIASNNRAGQLWAISEHTLYAYDAQGAVIPLPSRNKVKHKKDDYEAIAVDSTNGNVWLVTEHSVIWLNAQGEEQARLSLKNKSKKDKKSKKHKKDKKDKKNKKISDIKHLSVDGAGNVWAVGKKDVLRLSIDSSQTPNIIQIDLQRRLKEHHLLDAQANQIDQTLWIAAERKLTHIGVDGQTISSTKPGGKHRKLIALALPDGDQTPPSIAITYPLNNQYIGTQPPISVSYSDDQSGINPNILQISIDGQVVTTQCNTTADTAGCALDQPLTGTQDQAIQISASIEDNAQNTGTSETISVKLDVTAPTISITSPTANAVVPSRPVIALTLDDVGSGLYEDSLSITINGQLAVATCTITPTTNGNTAQCALNTDLPANTNTIQASVSDQVGLSTISAAINVERDRDGDGVADSADVFPDDPTESADLDNDGIGDNADPDRDGDGVINTQDAFPNDPTETNDLDGDGIGDNSDPDKDGDGVDNAQDAFPNDPNESADLDGDGIGDNADTDRDGDGISNDYETQAGTNPNDPASTPPDLDTDGIPDSLDDDKDGDGVDNAQDAFPNDPNESSDLDGDGIGDNADTDRDGDGISNDFETQLGTDPNDPASTPPDIDADGTPDSLDDDRDGDGVDNAQDAFPNDPTETNDLDNDGIGDNADTDRDGDGISNDFETQLGTDPNDPASTPPDLDGDGTPDSLDDDRDGDGVANAQDAFPNDPTESSDLDSDGIGDNADPDRDGDGISNDYETQTGTDPNDPASTPPDLDTDGIPDSLDDDRDGDGVNNDVDAFPNDPNESSDLDGDGIGDNSDPDKDGDGVDNAQDAFPNDPAESSDLDNDGIGDNADTDRDGDGVDNAQDAFPNDPTESSDIDNDGIGDNSDPDRDGDGVDNTQDAFPNDPNESTDLDNDGIGDNSDPDRDGDGVNNDADAFPEDANQSRLPTITIDSPASQITVGITPQAITGSIDLPQNQRSQTGSIASLTINGAVLTPAAGGTQGQFTFAANVVIEEGQNTVQARLVDSYNNVVTAVVSVSLDTTEPYVTIESHTDGQTVYDANITLTGLINDIVRGTVSDGQATVSVNGINASIDNRSYRADNIPLTAGANTIIATGTDAVGNVGTTQITLNYVIVTGKQIETISGADQSGPINTALASPLVVKLLDDLGQPVANTAIIWRVAKGSGTVLDPFDNSPDAKPARGIITLTDANGQASAAFTLGARAGQGNHQVTAQAVGYDNTQTFLANATPINANKLSVNSGNNQRAAQGQPLGQPLIVVATDNGNNRIKGANIQFEVTKGSGSLRDPNDPAAKPTTITVATDSDGRATAQFTVGTEAGLDIHRVTATILNDDGSGNLSKTGLTAGFSASALISGDPGNTRITGTVLDNQDNPVPGVTIRVDGVNRQGIADEQGNFQIDNVPVGPVHLLVEGQTTTRTGDWPTLSYNLITVAGAVNPLSAPIYLVPLDTQNAMQVGQADVEYTLPEVPGFKLTIKKDSITFPDGSKTGLLSVTAVNANKIPMAPPNGMQPQFIVTIQPTGAVFDPPAPLTLPNVDGYLPGAQVEMFSYDHDLEEFVTIGLGTISKDGSVIESNPGVGVIKAGWHCGSGPGPDGCANGCGLCKGCDANCNCFTDDVNGPKPNICNKCENGSPVADDTQIPFNYCRECDNGSDVADITKDNKLVPGEGCTKCDSGNKTPIDQTADPQDGGPPYCKTCQTAADGGAEYVPDPDDPRVANNYKDLDQVEGDCTAYGCSEGGALSNVIYTPDDHFECQKCTQNPLPESVADTGVNRQCCNDSTGVCRDGQCVAPTIVLDGTIGASNFTAAGQIVSQVGVLVDLGATDCPSLEFNWTFSDGGSAQGQIATHIFAPGAINLSATVVVKCTSCGATEVTSSVGLAVVLLPNQEPIETPPDEDPDDDGTEPLIRFYPSDPALGSCEANP